MNLIVIYWGEKKNFGCHIAENIIFSFLQKFRVSRKLGVGEEKIWGICMADLSDEK